MKYYVQLHLDLTTTTKAALLQTSYLRPFESHLESSLILNLIIHSFLKLYSILFHFILVYLFCVWLCCFKNKQTFELYAFYSIFLCIDFFISISVAGTKKMEYKTRQWHEKCFSCCVCKNPIGTKSFIPKEQDIYCAGCYEEKYATRCIKCSKV